MRTVLFTAYDKKYSELAKRTVPRMAEWAKENDYYFDHGGSMCDDPDGIYWTKVQGALTFLRSDFDRVFWMDVDQLITSKEYRIPEEWTGLHLPLDWGYDATHPHHFSVCAFVADKSCVPLFLRWLSKKEESHGKPFPEQEPMRKIAKEGWQTDPAWPVITIHGRKPMNAVPDEVCPGKVPDPWVIGDFAAHITMLDIDARVKLADDILSRL